MFFWETEELQRNYVEMRQRFLQRWAAWAAQREAAQRDDNVTHVRFVRDDDVQPN